MEKNVPIPLPNLWTSSSSLRIWSQLPVLTATLPILPLEQLKRQSIPFIHSFGSSYQLVATGITSPLRVTCVAHDGSNFNQILKNDEIRSDCVVQQLFELLNRLLAEKNIESQNPSYRDIHLRIYRVSLIAIMMIRLSVSQVKPVLSSLFLTVLPFVIISFLIRIHGSFDSFLEDRQLTLLLMLDIIQER